ncbi:SCP2 sterol-binding domain-containing protein [Alphaproteobacteria bacterium]|nr:SCP2 sterol-binding domain-containing protein [Alphaproteobacteria bacterium]
MALNLQELTSKLGSLAASAPSIGAKIKFDFESDGILSIDGTASPMTVSNDDMDADTTVKCSLETVEGLIAGTVNPTTAVMMGKIKVSGDISKAMSLASLLKG